MARFTAGKSGNPAGRKKGVRTKAKLEAEQAARDIVDDPEYRANLRARALRGELAPAVETMLHHYAHGKPIEKHEHSGPNGEPLLRHLAGLTPAEAAMKVREAADVIEKAPLQKIE